MSKNLDKQINEKCDALKRQLHHTIINPLIDINVWHRMHKVLCSEINTGTMRSFNADLHDQVEEDLDEN